MVSTLLTICGALESCHLIIELVMLLPWRYWSANTQTVVVAWVSEILDLSKRMDKKIVIKNYDDQGVVISVQDKMANGTFGSSSDVELSHEELRGLSFQEVMDVVCGDV